MPLELLNLLAAVGTAVLAHRIILAARWLSTQSKNRTAPKEES